MPHFPIAAFGKDVLGEKLQFKNNLIYFGGVLDNIHFCTLQ
jgi:hypothetical protein